MSKRHFRLEFEVAGLVHIGDGTKFGKKDYFAVGNGQVGILDVGKFIAELTPEQLDTYCELLRQDGRDAPCLEEFLKDNALRKVAERCLAYKVDMTLTRAKRGAVQYYDVAAFVKDAYGLPYIPGSSVKGMFRTALLNSLLLADRCSYTARDKGRRGQDGRIVRTALYLEHLDSNPQSAVNDILRYVSVSDSAPLSVGDLVFAKKYDKFCKADNGFHKHDMGKLSDEAYYEGNELNIYRECFRPGTRFSVDVDIDERLDGFVGATADAAWMLGVFKESFELYKMCFLDHFETEDGACGAGGAGNASADAGGQDDGRCRYVIAAGPLAGTRCRNRSVEGTGYCNTHKDKAAQAAAAAGAAGAAAESAICYLGGGVDFAGKTVLNALFSDDAKRVDEMACILYEQFPTKLDPKLHGDLKREVCREGFGPRSMTAKRARNGRLLKGKDDHRHWRDGEFGVSPHTMKYGIIGTERYPMGKCKACIKER